MANNYTVTVTQPETGPMVVEPPQLPVRADNVGDVVNITFTPGPDTVITSIAGFPTGVVVSGPNALNEWTASYTASSIQSVWSYYISAFYSAAASRTKNDTHDPEIDNTPPPQGP
jgi:hypothetical protein